MTRDELNDKNDPGGRIRAYRAYFDALNELSFAATLPPATVIALRLLLREAADRATAAMTTEETILLGRIE